MKIIIENEFKSSFEERERNKEIVIVNQNYFIECFVVNIYSAAGEPIYRKY